MTTPYVYISAQTPLDPPPQDSVMYFWGSVVGLLVLMGVVLFVLYGLQSPTSADSDERTRVETSAPALLTQLPLYLGSTLFSDPIESSV
jgi:hypothetical protein